MFTYLHKISRKKKMELFRSAMKPANGSRMLDVGVIDSEPHEIDNWLEKNIGLFGDNLFALGITDLSGLKKYYPEVKFIQGDGCSLPFKDNTFDIVFSNAVVEHVGDCEKQVRFIHELVRVGKRIFVTTPNFYYPIEIHTRLPFVHLLPYRIRNFILAKSGKMQFSGVCNNLLTAKKLRSLFPKGIHIKIFKVRVTFFPETLAVAAYK